MLLTAYIVGIFLMIAELVMNFEEGILTKRNWLLIPLIGLFWPLIVALFLSVKFGRWLTDSSIK